jgi:glycosyltransferase involved in cell wall biosynthesis
LKVVLCCPTIKRPYDAFLEAARAEVPLLDAAGIDHALIWEVGCPYISHARSTMLRKALDTQPDAVVFLDHDMSWEPGVLLRLIETPGDVVAGVYRFKRPDEAYMGTWKVGPEGSPLVREDGCIRGDWVPAGFLKVSVNALRRFARAYPELTYGDPLAPHIDLFNHGAHKGLWYGEDYAFSRRWNDCGGEIWIVPDLKLHHNGPDGTVYPGDFHSFLRRQPGGDLHEA